MLIEDVFREFFILFDLFLVNGVLLREDIFLFLFFLLWWKVFCLLILGFFVGLIDIILGGEFVDIKVLCIVLIWMIGLEFLLISLGRLNLEWLGYFIGLVVIRLDFKLIGVFVFEDFCIFIIFFLGECCFLVDEFDDRVFSDGEWLFFSLYWMFVRIWVGFILLVLDFVFCKRDGGIEDGFRLIRSFIFWGFIRIWFMVFWWVILCMLFLLILRIMLLIWSLL